MHTKKYAFNVEKACRSHRADGRELWTLTVKSSELPLEFKFGPNARYASLDTKPAKEMLATLREDPGSFIYKNNGVMVVAENLHAEGSRVEIECREPDGDEDGPGHGILNGGHTYRVLQAVMASMEPDYAKAKESAIVMMTVGIGIPDEEIVRISRARNTSQPVPLHAIRELAGDWSLLKKFLPDASRSLVAFKMNDPEATDAEYDATDLVRRLALLNNRLFPAEQGRHPTAAYTSIGSLVKQYQAKDFLEIAPCLADAIHLEELTVKMWEQLRGHGENRIAIGQASGVTVEKHVLLSGYEAALDLPDPFVLPVIAAFRVFLTDGKWHESPDQLFAKFGERTIRALWEQYKSEGKSSAAMFGRAKASWAAACDLTKSAAIQMGLVKVV